MKTVLITGGIRGLGLSIAHKFASNNYNLVLNYVSNDDVASKVKDEIINKYGVEVLLIKADVSNEEDVKKMYLEVINKLGFVDCVINNAGIAIDSTLEDKTVETVFETAFLYQKLILDFQEQVRNRERVLYSLLLSATLSEFRR